MINYLKLQTKILKEHNAYVTKNKNQITTLFKTSDGDYIGDGKYLVFIPKYMQFLREDCFMAREFNIDIMKDISLVHDEVRPTGVQRKVTDKLTVAEFANDNFKSYVNVDYLGMLENEPVKAYQLNAKSPLILVNEVDFPIMVICPISIKDNI